MIQPVIIETWNTLHDLKIGYACLNMPEQLNSLNLEMIQELKQALLAWQEDPKVCCVILDGQGEKAFCAGGDVRKLYHAAKQRRDEDEQTVSHFFTQEYQLDYLIHQYEKPILVWGDGIVMGGGLGLMVGASHRVATERTKIAMPEVTIGLYPDVGGSYFLNQMPAKMGLFLGLTAYRMQAGDALYVGLVDFIVASDQKQQVFEQLKGLDWQSEASLNHHRLSACLTQCAQASQVESSSLLAEHRLLIEDLMSGNLNDIEERIQTLDTSLPWLQRACKTMLAGSPLSRALVWYQHQLDENMTLAEAFRLEVMLSVNCCMRGDFVEGVRAQLIEKDYQPKWQAYQGIECMLKQPWATNPLVHLSP
tara:strand:+ start:3035 stop:4126 length:1092 start_codon:yes stop_codon:yes gene_type:complete